MPLTILRAALLTVSTLTETQTPAPDAALVRAVDSVASVAIRDGLAPALGVAIVRDGKVIYARSHGLTDVSAGVAADNRTLWYTASTSKSYLGFAVALLADRGELRMDAPITTLLPGVPWHPGARAEQLTLDHFLSHTHNLNDNAIVQSASFTGAIPESRWPRLIALAAPTGTQDLIYSNFGYNVAGMVLDALYPGGWRDVLQQHVFNPAGLHETFGRVSGLDPRRIARPHRLQADGRYATEPFAKTDATLNSAGGHLATMNDLARWMIVQMDSGRIDGRQVFSATAVARSHRLIARQTRDQARRFAFFDREGWSSGWDIGAYEGERMVSRFGSYHTTRSHLGFLPRRRIGVAAMSTGGLGSSLTDLIAAYVYDLESGRSDAHTRVTERLAALRTRLATARTATATSDSTRAARQRQSLGRPLADFTGRFAEPSYGELVFTLRDGGLGYRWGVLQGPVEIFDASRNQLRIEIAGSGTVVAFAFGDRGPAASIEVQGVTFSRVRSP